jgi:hypothetical protein
MSPAAHWIIIYNSTKVEALPEAFPKKPQMEIIM